MPGVRAGRAPHNAPVTCAVARNPHRGPCAAEAAAMASLHDAGARWVRGSATGISRDPAEAEEVLGDGLAPGWGRMAQHEPSRGPLVPWVLSIARNRSLDALRRRRRWWRKADRWGAAQRLEDDGAVPAPDPADAAVPRWAVHQEGHAPLAPLPVDQRRVGM